MLWLDAIPEGPRLPSDAPALHEAYRDPDVMRFWSSPPHGSMQETIAYVTPHANDQWRQWVIVDKTSGRAIGTLAAGERRRGVMEIETLRQAIQRPQARYGLTAKISPGRTPDPSGASTASTASSWPMTRGYWRNGCLPSKIW